MVRHKAIVAYGGGDDDWACLHATEDLAHLVNRANHWAVFSLMKPRPPRHGVWVCEAEELPRAVQDGSVAVEWRGLTDGEWSALRSGDGVLDMMWSDWSGLQAREAMR